MKEVLDTIPELKGWTDYEDISTGLINKIYKVKIKNKYKILRLLNENSFDLGINRTEEFYNSHIIQETKVVPKVLGFDGLSKKYLITEYLPGKVLVNNDLKDKSKMFNVIDSMKKFHTSQKFLNEFDPFKMILFYEGWLSSKGYKFKKDRIKIKLIKKYMKRDLNEFVSCHNDIRAYGNIIETKNGIKFVDLEFTGNNDPCYEIGFLWSESKLSIDDLHMMIYYYFGKDVIKNSAKAQLYAIVSDYMWYLQGLVGNKLGNQEDVWLMYSTITYDNFKNKSKIKNLIPLLISLF
jgi:thiamine kinase-like enzyme